MSQPILYVEERNFFNLPHPRILQTLQGKKHEFSIGCDFICPSHSDSKEIKTYTHPSPPFNRLFVIERGTASIRTQYGTKILTKGNIYFLPAEMAFEATYHKSKIKGFHLHLTDGFGFTIGSEIQGIQEITDKHYFNTLITAIESEIDAFWTIQVFYALLHFCHPLFPSLEERASLSPRQKQLLELIEKAPPGNLRISDLAKKLHTSRAALTKSFQRHFKISLKAHLMNSSIRRAKKLLLHSDLTISEIAFQLGYEDPAYFHRLFKNQVGETPLNYRNSSSRED